MSVSDLICVKRDVYNAHVYAKRGVDLGAETIILFAIAVPIHVRLTKRLLVQFI